MKRIFTALVALSVGGVAAVAEDRMSANYIVPKCWFEEGPAPNQVISAYEAGRCAGIVEMLGVMLQANARLPKNERGLCARIPDNVTFGQEIRIVVDYIKARPTRMHENFKLLALEALTQAWPCR